MYICVSLNEQTWYYITLTVACIPWFLHLLVICCSITSIIYGYVKLYKVSNPADTCIELLPGVSIIKPLNGTDGNLLQNLESHFELEYPAFELLFCVQDEKDPVLNLLYTLQDKYPHVNSRVFQGGKGILNPLVDNMAPAYEACQYNLVWISTSRVKATSKALIDMVSKIQPPNVALVHQMPFTSNKLGLPAALEKIYFGTVVPRFYFVSDLLHIVCFTGMSYLVKKSELDQVHGLPWYGRYMAEDYFLAKALHERGFRLSLSAMPVEQNVAEMSISSYMDRMLRWQKLRINMLPLVGGVLEPLGESIPLCIYLAWSAWYLFQCNPTSVFCVMLSMWCLLDYLLLRSVQVGKLPFNCAMYVSAWLLRQTLFVVTYFRALLTVRYIKWGSRRYRLSNFGRSLELASRKPILPI